MNWDCGYIEIYNDNWFGSCSQHNLNMQQKRTWLYCSNHNGEVVLRKEFNKDQFLYSTGDSKNVVS